MYIAISTFLLALNNHAAGIELPRVECFPPVGHVLQTVHKERPWVCPELPRHEQVCRYKADAEACIEKRKTFPPFTLG